jgi:hypothetical protein
VQKEVLKFYGFKVEDPLFIGWQYTRDVKDESEKSYENAAPTFQVAFNMDLLVKKNQETDFELNETNEEDGFPTFLKFISNI